ncbi:unnamed protein product [Medioppia subpectinata]|uniref:Uncharacterized protein n=1 Tax=Medioppia subpectinata TaxID=1979941 RepID=A0A7R9KS37_9ACAR|nr:unnamed protein product [Medioppia subpectinata]CAG2108350.1 unnamed protein product [Medioppia subpectinata]
MTVVVVFMLYITICFARNSMPDRTDDNFQNDCLKTSNDLRARHHAPGFHLDHDAVNYAKSRCQLISQYEGLSHGHAGLKGYGENLYWGGNSVDVTGSCGTTKYQSTITTILDFLALQAILPSLFGKAQRAWAVHVAPDGVDSGSKRTWCAVISHKVILLAIITGGSKKMSSDHDQIK